MFSPRSFGHRGLGRLHRQGGVLGKSLGPDVIGPLPGGRRSSHEDLVFPVEVFLPEHLDEPLLVEHRRRQQGREADEFRHFPDIPRVGSAAAADEGGKSFDDMALAKFLENFIGLRLSIREWPVKGRPHMPCEISRIPTPAVSTAQTAGG